MRGANQGALQPAEVIVRHIRPSATVTPGGFDAQPVTVLNTSFRGTVQGLNGKRGWQVAKEDSRLQEEGQLDLTIPNTTGEDGVRHMDRFRCLVDPYYQVGDEWIEIYRATAADKPLFVGSPADWNVDNGVIQLTLVDAWWAQNLQRDTAAAFLLGSPRDLWEQYTRAVVQDVADDFSTNTFAYATAETVTPAYKYTQSLASSGGVLMNPKSAAGSIAYIRSTKTLPVGLASSDPHSWWRIQARVALTRTGGFADEAVVIGMVTAGGANGCYLQLIADGRILVYSSGASGAFQSIVNAYATFGSAATQYGGTGTTWDLAIEGRGRWLFYYVNGRLIDVMPMTTTNSGDLYPQVWAGNGTAPESRFLLQEFKCRSSKPYLLRGTQKGDYRIPGNPAARGLQASYFPGTSLVQKYPSDWTALLGRPAVDQDPTQRVEAALNMPTSAAQNYPGASGTPWVPTGFQQLNYGARYTGAIYLDVENYDYAFRIMADDAARVWVGKTRWGEHIIDDHWGTDASGYTYAYSKWMKAGNQVTSATEAPSGATGQLNGMKSGWYPFMVEFYNHGASGMLRFEYMRSDALGMWVVPGEGSLPHMIRTAAPKLYWKLGEGMENWAVEDHSGNFLHGSYGNQPPGQAGIFQGMAGWVPGSLQTLFNAPSATSSGAYAARANVAINMVNHSFSWECVLSLSANIGTNGLTSYVPIMIGSAGATNQAIYLWIGSGGSNLVGVGNWGTTVFSPTVLKTETAYHIAVTYDYPTSTTKLYINGALVLTTTGIPAYTGTATPNVIVGRNYFRTTSDDYFYGKGQHFAIYEYTLNASEILKHANLVLGATDPGLGSTFSPIGVIQQDGARFDSYYEGLKSIIDSYGIQSRLEPMSLESGEFPGRLVPKVRVGRDTAYVLDEDEAINVAVKGTARDSVSSLIGDAQGLADPTGATDVAVERTNFQQALNHFLLTQGVESMGDMTDVNHVLQRLGNLLSLRASPWEEVGAQPNNKRTLVGNYPLPTPGTEQEFDWQPGDGVLLNQPRIGVVDTVPRQILGRSRTLVPDGIGEYQAQFRQRPRSNKELMRRMLRQFAVANRNYQGQIVTVVGSIGALGVNDVATGAAPDRYTRISIPSSAKQVVKVFMNVLSIQGGTTNRKIQTAYGDTGITVVTPGRYDITAFYQPINDAANNRFYATLGITGDRYFEAQLEAWVVI